MYLTSNSVLAQRRAMLGFLGATTKDPPQSPSSANAAAAMQALAIPQNDAYYNWTLQAIEQGVLPDYEPGVLTGTAVQFTGGSAGCSSEKGSAKAALTGAVGSTASSVGGTLVTAGAATSVTPVGWVLLGVGAILGGLSFLFSHHAKAVAQERGTLCAYVPAANAALEQLAEWFQAGQITAQTYIQSLQSVEQQFASGTHSVSSTTNWTRGTCNEGCIYNRALRGIVGKLTADLQTSATGTGAAGSAAGAPTGSSSLLLPAAAL